MFVDRFSLIQSLVFLDRAKNNVAYIGCGNPMYHARVVTVLPQAPSTSRLAAAHELSLRISVNFDGKPLVGKSTSSISRSDAG
jgi:hypothetical protein